MSNETVPGPKTTTAAHVQRPGWSWALSAPDLLNVAIFAVIYLVVIFAINMLGLINPPVMLLALLLGVIVASIPYMLFLTRVKHAGMVALFGAALGVVFALTGLGWIAGAATVLLSLVGEVVLWLGHYRSRWAAIGANTVFALSSAAPFIPLLIDREAYLSSDATAGTDPDFVQATDQLLTLPVVWGFFAATLVCGLLGALLGSALLKKHFVRAGLA